MRYRCSTCGKSVTSEVPDESIVRAVLTCPECIERNIVHFSDDVTFPLTKDEAKLVYDELLNHWFNRDHPHYHYATSLMERLLRFVERYEKKEIK